jgi:hypothetical protein
MSSRPQFNNNNKDKNDGNKNYTVDDFPSPPHDSHVKDKEPGACAAAVAGSPSTAVLLAAKDGHGVLPTVKFLTRLQPILPVTLSLPIARMVERDGAAESGCRLFGAAGPEDVTTATLSRRCLAQEAEAPGAAAMASAVAASSAPAPKSLNTR